MRTPDYPSRDSDDWAKVDSYFTDLLAPADSALEASLEANANGGLPAYDVSPMQGKMLALFVTMTGAKRVLEIGTLGGYSTIWMARALPEGGSITTIESVAHHAEVARKNIANAGVTERVDLRVGAALDVLPELTGPFDLVFIDADKPNNPSYLEWSMKLARPGTVIIGDNVVRGGAVTDSDSRDPNVRGVRTFLEMISEDPRLEATAIQTVGEKGWDGFVMAVVKAR
ncbi:related to caffeoyl-coa o-methyltransferase [Cephalotrichum gorgonifer]|uniref:Related to caffeoyl-coa o-methyltransferase n=1 Tax=Cephalotrichum gorgonifer TaxID=2041049 RepID=A0AAE8N6H6_9PEZI|nr:related to caffeoyl-coa o-methyltransferase [Cephalotrichum gorgonifer]